MRVLADIEGAGDTLALAVVADRLGDRQDMRLVERAAKRRAPVAAGAETHSLSAICDVGLARVVLLSQLLNVDEKFLRSRFACHCMDRHGIISSVQSLAAPARAV